MEQSLLQPEGLNSHRHVSMCSSLLPAVDILRGVVAGTVLTFFCCWFRASRCAYALAHPTRCSCWLGIPSQTRRCRRSSCRPPSCCLAWHKAARYVLHGWLLGTHWPPLRCDHHCDAGHCMLLIPSTVS